MVMQTEFDSSGKGSLSLAPGEYRIKHGKFSGVFLRHKTLSIQSGKASVVMLGLPQTVPCNLQVVMPAGEKRAEFVLRNKLGEVLLADTLRKW